jgi:hypothetical protein
MLTRPDPNEDDDDEEDRPFMVKHFIRMTFPFLLSVSTFLGSWLFWAGFVHLVSDRHVIAFTLYTLEC